jgi:hypothetical protein
MTVPLIDLEELALNKVFDALLVLEVYVVLQDYIILSIS